MDEFYIDLYGLPWVWKTTINERPMALCALDAQTGDMITSKTAIQKLPPEVAKWLDFVYVPE